MSEELKRIGAQMANVMFNLARLPGERITYQQAETFGSLSEQWDAATRATPPAPVEGQALPPLPKVGPICYAMVADIQEYRVPRVGKQLVGVFDAALWSTDQMQAYARQAIEADRREQAARIAHLTDERDKARADCAQLAQAQQVERDAEAPSWLPIESAPHDGQAVLLTRTDAGGAWIGKYEPVYQSGYRPDNPWFSLMLNRDYMPKPLKSSEPTHWMPLPSAPKVTP